MARGGGGSGSANGSLGGEAQTQQGAARRGRNRGYRRRRGGGNAAAASTEIGTNANANGSEVIHSPPPPPPPTQAQTTTETGRSRGGRNRARGGGGVRGGRGGRGGGASTTTMSTGLSRREFGGQLTREEDFGGEHNGEGGGEGLRADAPEFVPGGAGAAMGGARQEGGGRRGGKRAGRGRGGAAATQSAGPSTRTQPPPQPQPQPRQRTPAAKSTAPDIATRTHEDIAHNIYECPICTSELGRRSKVWSCRLCWTVFHLSCIKKWSKNEGSVFARQQQQGEEPSGEVERQWRCPGCNLPQDILPSTYSCWCGKEVDPRPVPGLPPHSCGQTCSRARKGGHCPHPCDSICHAGPCQPCTSTGPTQSCFCGKRSVTKKCVDTDYVKGWSCGEVCGDLLPCGEHECRRECHEGLCGGCEEMVDARCYCGKVERKMLCSAKDEEVISKREGEAEWVGAFDCGEGCGRLFDCGNHACEKACHPQDEEAPHCPQAPDMVTTCPCGKTPLQKIPGFTPRTSCEDPIPSCKEACGKKLPCQHPCPLICHTGPCPPCERSVDIKCRCGRSSFPAICHEGMDEPPKCDRVCRAAMNCGRHSCGKECCSGERKAVERQATKRKLKSLSAAAAHVLDEDVEAEHICTKICGRALKCGLHNCPDLCHRGSCGTCREAIFEEIACHCGRSVLHPPLPCGTKPPPCRFDCERPKRCGHPVTQHNCHPDSESCPKCPFLTERKCLCGKQMLKNQPCWHTEARCGLVCGKILKCGSHTCQKNCHRPGDCEDAITPCVKPCGKTKKLCGHPCTESCHAPVPCSEKTPCSATVTITCNCGRLKQQKRCNATRGGSTKGSTQQSQPYTPTFTPLKCDEECSRLERNRSLASALNIEIDPSTTLTANLPSDSPTIPYSPDTLDKYISLSSTSTLPTLQSYESSLSTLATTHPSNTSPRPSIRFNPARAPLRSFIHSLSEDWGFRSESYDPEPHRHVLVYKPGGWTLPVPFAAGIMAGKTEAVVSVGECVKIRERERAREREEARIAAAVAAEAKALKGNGVDGDGWAQVASRKKVATPTTTGTPGIGNPVTAVPGYGYGFGSKGSLVLRSGVRKNGKGKENAGVNGFGAIDFGSDGEVVDSWEEEVEREEKAGEL
ncbi:FKBP12-associated protein [Arachnomyces sp. PD_36]|nr:FKBP12-associated protein [Arachnomyces sp. PD_36]